MKELMGIAAVNIIKAEDKSESNMDRLTLTFANGYMLSIIRGEYSYGGSSGLFEIAPMKVNGDWAPELFDEKDKGDDVLGWCSVERVSYYINKVSLYNNKGIE